MDFKARRVLFRAEGGLNGNGAKKEYEMKMFKRLFVALAYAMREGAALLDVKDCASKVCDEQSWTSVNTAKGGTSGFYALRLSTP